jgi:hypothetical protein
MYVCTYGTAKLTANILYKEVHNDLICFYVLLVWNWIDTNNIFSLYSVWHVKWKKYFSWQNYHSLHFAPTITMLPSHGPQYSYQYHYSNCVKVQGCWYSIDWLCAGTGLLVQHSLTVITINSNLTQCTVGAYRMFTDVYAISWQHSTVHIVTQCDINTTTYPTLNTLYHNQQ